MQKGDEKMMAKATLFVITGLLVAMPASADDGWYRFPTALEGKWKIADARIGDQNKDAYVGQMAEIDGSTILLRSDTASNTYRVTYVKPDKTQIELDLTATSPDGRQTKTFRCLLTVSANQIRLCRPQSDSHPRPRDIESPHRSETVFTFVRANAPSKP